MIQRFNIAHLVAATTASALLFATLQLPRSLAQAVVVIVLWGAFHVVLAHRYKCYESIFAGAASALLTAILVPYASGGWNFGGVWIGLVLDPMTVVRWIAMACVGGFVQIQYADAHREQEQRFERERRRLAQQTRKQKAEQ